MDKSNIIELSKYLGQSEPAELTESPLQSEPAELKGSPRHAEPAELKGSPLQSEPAELKGSPLQSEPAELKGSPRHARLSEFSDFFEEAEPSYKPFTPKAALELTSPPSWVASITSVLVGGVAAIALNPQTTLVFDARMICAWILMLITAVLMQAAVNTLNDYKDFISGLDTTETILEKEDASIVYNEIDPRHARTFAIVILAVAAVFGAAVVLLSGWPLLVVGIVAAAVVVLYSIGPKPISYLPIGELVSGIVMGGLITCSTYYAMTQTFSPAVITVAIPPIITIALLMQTNNTCDIWRDREVGRRTLPAVIGLEYSVILARLLAWATPVYMVIWVAAFDVIIWRSFFLLIFDVVVAAGLYFMLRGRLSQIASGPYNLVNRGMMMKNITEFCWLVNLGWVIILLVCWLLGNRFFIL